MIPNAILPFSITKHALLELKNLQEQHLHQQLRIGVKGGGCSGLSYVLEFDDTTHEDNFYLIENLNIVIQKAHELYLAGIEIDYANGLNNRGFIFKNPNASSTCGCGSSFAV